MDAKQSSSMLQQKIIMQSMGKEMASYRSTSGEGIHLKVSSLSYYTVLKLMLGHYMIISVWVQI